VSNYHADSKKFMPGKSTGVYRGQMKHGAGVEHFKDALHTEQRRTPIVSHEGVASVSASGVKPTQPKLDDGNRVANAKFNAGTVGARETTDPAKLIGAGIIKGN
jgi:hypothetical protein